MWTARIRRPDFRLIDPITYAKCTLVENYNMPNMLSITGKLSSLRSATAPGSGLVLTDDDGAQRFSGILVSVERRGEGDADLVYASDLVRLRHRIVWPTPLNAWTTAGQSSAYDSVTGPSETRMLYYIDRNAGPSSRSERRISRLRLPVDQGRGVDRRSSARFQNLGDLMAKFAEESNLRIDIEQTYETAPFHTWLDVKIHDVPDLSSWARFGTPEAGGPALLGEGWRYSMGVPTGTTILSAAGGQLTNRILNSYSGDQSEATVWGVRIEYFVDQRGSTDAEEIQAGMEDSWEETVGEKEISAPLGRSNLKIGTDIPLGAKVAVIIDGERIVERMRQVTTTMSDDAPTSIVPLIGTPDVGLQTPTQKRLAAMLKRVSNLERNV